MEDVQPLNPNGQQYEKYHLVFETKFFLPNKVVRLHVYAMMDHQNVNTSEHRKRKHYALTAGILYILPVTLRMLLGRLKFS